MLKIKEKERLKYCSYGDIDIIHGEIFDNIFVTKPINTQVIQWCLIPENEKMIKRILKRMFQLKNLYSGDLDVCFTYVLEYFSKPDKAFYKNYVDGDDYTIEKYVYSNLKYIFNIYRADILKKTSYTRNKISISNENFDEDYINNLDSIEQPEIFDFDYGLIISLKESIETYLLKNRYNIDGFGNLENFIFQMFISPISENIDENVNHINETLGVSSKLILSFIADLKKDFLHGDVDATRIFEKIKEIITIKNQ